MQVKKVLHIVSVSFSLPYFIGDQFNFFKKKGIDFTVACSASNHFTDYAKKMKFKPVDIHIERAIRPLTDLKSIYRLYTLIKKEKFQIVIGHSPKGALLSMIASFLAKTPKRIYFRHGLVFETSTGFKRRLLIFIEKFTGALATNVVNVSPSVEKISNNLKLNAASKNLMLNKGTCNGIDTVRFSKNNQDVQEVPIEILERLRSEERFVVGYVGRLSNDKGINILIDAWKMVVNSIPNARLLLVGPFDERDLLPLDVREYILKENSIVFTNLVSNTAPFYKLMDVFILPSFREGFPTVVLEASSMELPVITSRATGCIDSILEGKTGMFAQIDAQDIYNKIVYYNDSGNRELHGQNGREFVQDAFKQELIWEEIDRKIFN